MALLVWGVGGSSESAAHRCAA